MKHLDLFSGIGGFALAAERVWPGIEHIFCDNEPYAQEILKKHWPNSKIYGDIRTLTTDTRSPQYGRLSSSEREAISEIGEVYLLTGGFPCQPFSQAGRRKGKDDDRFLWPEMLRVIKEFRPTWIVGENVAGILSMAQQQSNPKMGGEEHTEDGDYDNDHATGIIWDIINDIEQAGYSVQTFVIPAVAVGAPHRRDRVWIVGHSCSAGTGKQSERIHRGEIASESGKREDIRDGTNATDSNAPDSTAKGLQQRGEARSTTSSGSARRRGLANDGSWNENWLEVATRLCRVDDGLSSRLARLPDGRKISYSKWRQEALKGLGNAWVPQVAEEIFKAIKQTHESLF